MVLPSLNIYNAFIFCVISIHCLTCVLIFVLFFVCVYIPVWLGELLSLEIINGFCQAHTLHILIHQRYGVVFLSPRKLY